MGKPPKPPEPPEVTLVCAGCKTQVPLSQYRKVRPQLYVFGPDGYGVYENLPYCSKECWEDRSTPTKREVRSRQERCHHGARNNDQCENPGEYTCGFNCCSCRYCDKHRAPDMVPIGVRTRRVQARRAVSDPVLAAIMRRIQAKTRV